MVVFDVHIGEDQASWERQKVIPESVDDACALSSPSGAVGQQSRSAKAAASWQVPLRSSQLGRCTQRFNQGQFCVWSYTQSLHLMGDNGSCI